MALFTPDAPAASHPADTGGKCPVDHRAYSHRKTLRAGEDDSAPPIYQDADGVWHISGYSEARTVLRSRDTTQAGFKSELMDNAPMQLRKPVLFADGKEHQQYRRETARFFSPRTTDVAYREMMNQYADEIVADLLRNGQAQLSDLSMKLAVRVAGAVVGLTNSRLPGIEKRLEAFFEQEPGDFGWTPRAILDFARTQSAMMRFYWLDVKPAINARREQPQEDVISHLLENEYEDSEILIECITYGAAGMVTTREFISIVTWHMMENPDLRAHYLAADEETRHHILNEIVRLEPIVGNLMRRASADIVVESEGREYTIAAGDLIDLHIYQANVDERTVGEAPQSICPAREIDRVHPSVMAFGDGAHRCPGAYIAIQETDILLTKLLALDNLRVEHPPHIDWKEFIKGYEVRGFVLAVD